MKEYTRLEACSFKPRDQVVLALGVFDGIHGAHKTIIDECKKRARRRNGTAVIFTFQNHPASILRPQMAPGLLTPYPLKRQLMEQLGVDVLLGIPFDEELSRTPASDFVERILHRQLCAQEIVVGFNFRFGHQRQGNTDLLRRYAPSLFEEVTVIERQSLHEELISSTLIRQKVLQGDLLTVHQLLDRPYQLAATVIRGAGRGRTLGIPTANLQLADQILPPNGVYGVQLRRQQITAEPYWGVMNIGTIPTFTDQSRRTVEVHILDEDLNLYDQFVIVDLLTKIRNERKFSGPQELIAQIGEDIAFFRDQYVNRIHP